MKKSLIVSTLLCVCVFSGIFLTFTFNEVLVNPDKISIKNTTGTLGNFNAESSTALHLIDEEWRRNNAPNLSDLTISKNPFTEKGQKYFNALRNHLIDPNPKKSISTLDSLSSTILDDKNISRQEKLRIFWNIIQEFGINTDVGSYMLDIFSELRPMEYLSEITKLADVASPRTQRQLARAIAKMFTLDPSTIEGDLVKIAEFEKNRSEAQKFFQTQFAHVSDKDTLMNLLGIYPSVLTLDQGLPNAIQTSLEKNKNLLSPQEYAKYKFNLLSFQRERHSEFDLFLRETVSKNPDYRRGVNEQLYAELAGPTAEIFIANQSTEWKGSIHAYLNEQKPIYDGKDISLWADEYGMWANANINIKGNTNYSQNLTDFLDQSSLIEQIVVLDRLVKSQIPLSQDTLDVIKNKDYINKITTNLGSLSSEDMSIATQILPTIEIFRR